MTEFIPSAAERVALATREVERRMRNQPGPRARWFKHKGKSFALQLYELTLESPGEKDTIAWDADAGAFFVWGQPVDETAEPMVIDGEADVEKLWITAQYSDAEQRVDGLSSFAVGHRVYTTTRNGRREIVAPQFHDPRWEIVKNEDSTSALNGYAARVTSVALLENDEASSDRVPLFDVEQGARGTIEYFAPTHGMMINSPRTIAAGDFGRATFAADRPVYAAVTQECGYVLLGTVLGPMPGSWLLYPGLPGFVALAVGDTDLDEVYRVPVIRDLTTQCWECQAYEDWTEDTTPWVAAHPRTPGGYPYDGTGTYPNIEMRVLLPRGGSGDDPNIHDGDVFWYTISSLGSFVGFTPYLDGKVGDIRFLVSGRNGWAMANGTANAVHPFGGTGRDLMTTARFPRFAGSAGGIGGGTTHAHTLDTGGAGNIAAGNYPLNQTNHLPPYVDFVPYERIH